MQYEKSGVRSQESGVRSQESEVESNIKSGSIGVIRFIVWGPTPNPSQEGSVGSVGSVRR
ncbi:MULTISPECIES: hypothetical protein [Okeania]|uniref:hypothetical protein n=1 Tax=Okeania TaxID=1458928 RepID=UPI000F52C19F|nr:MULTISPECIES: hypothetical protein [Okeania]NET11794.1 hypothetical protein [Okeania sp. SIO1H6]NES75416.1 hypothetical protein [Okeania sp. SIO1H4]NET17837.1 hypothetical protein [Okeania sp. SIO1H5]NET77340.1 hypothetical protein [Okeania sp. SIO1F9]NET92697.1 hypothetical protein [Okeania sp. SIO1H2]